jgi:hypothetical protein
MFGYVLHDSRGDRTQSMVRTDKVRIRIRSIPRTVRVPNNHPPWSSGVLVLVEGAAESISSADLQVCDLSWFGDPFG